MKSDIFSVIVRCWYDPQAGTARLQVVDTGTTEQVKLSDASFVLRISTDVETSISRCHILHIASGHEAYIQGGSNMYAFVKAYVLRCNSSEVEHADQGK